MYKEIINTLSEQINDINQQIIKLTEDKNNKIKAKDAIELLQCELEAKNNNLAIQKGICPFDKECSLIKTCTKDYCNADTCSNGYAYRMS